MEDLLIETDDDRGILFSENKEGTVCISIVDSDGYATKSWITLSKPELLDVCKYISLNLEI